ncbi:hypothetical protein [Streptomyces sp. NPDC017890]|uniref:hypothetical protein n=1 Tax=Streptomyces sp. NPDC017890 TaxID=3365015 RepID=UPI003797202E
MDSTAAKAHHDAAGMLVDAEVLTTLEKAVEEEKPRAKRADGGGRRICGPDSCGSPS